MDDFVLESMDEHILKDFINELVRKVRIFAEEITTKRFNGAYIDHNRLYVKSVVRNL